MTATRLAFELPSVLEAHEPPEARGVPRDGVRMMVTHRSTGMLIDSCFRLLPMLLEPGDLLVVNTSATIPAAIDAISTDGTPVAIHLSTWIGGEIWVVEPRRPCQNGTERWQGEGLPRSMILGERAQIELLEPYRGSERLWIARVELPQPAFSWLSTHGRPIRYGYVERRWPIGYYQSVFATEPGSAEMPSAGRPFTRGVIERLLAKGVRMTSIMLHTGVASLDADEYPFPERVRVPEATADEVNSTREAGHRVVAVGTTVVRALESAADDDGHLEALDDWTSLVITPERGANAVDGILTGWHEPEASHLLMLEAIAGRELLESSYASALAAKYRWHEFGDTHLVLP
jgi:S-adenosylmethionine:tRNA ribosyltransferase-isomerase